MFEEKDCDVAVFRAWTCVEQSVRSDDRTTANKFDVSVNEVISATQIAAACLLNS